MQRSKPSGIPLFPMKATSNTSLPVKKNIAQTQIGEIPSNHGPLCNSPLHPCSQSFSRSRRSPENPMIPFPLNSSLNRIILQSKIPHPWNGPQPQASAAFKVELEIYQANPHFIEKKAPNRICHLAMLE